MPFREITSKNINNPNDNDEKEHPCVVGQVDIVKTGLNIKKCHYLKEVLDIRMMASAAILYIWSGPVTKA